MATEFQEVADGVLVRRHRPFDVNAGLVLGDDGALVIDTRAHGRGHTDSDVVVDVDDAVSLAGDLIEESAPPAFRDAFPRAWVATLDRIVPDLAEVLVPGHGAVVDIDFVRSQRADIVAVIERAADGRTGDGPWPRQVLEVIADRLAGEPDD